MAKFKAKLDDILVSISWGHIAMDYFGQSPKWLYQKLEKEIGEEDAFTNEELSKFKEALRDLADRIRQVSDAL